MKWKKTAYHDIMIRLFSYKTLWSFVMNTILFCWIKFIIKVAIHNKWRHLAKQIEKWKSMIQTSQLKQYKQNEILAQFKLWVS